MDGVSGVGLKLYWSVLVVGYESMYDTWYTQALLKYIEGTE